MLTIDAHKGMVQDAVFSPDGKLLLSSGEDRTMKLWDVATNKLIRTYRGHGDRVFSVNFAPDGKRIVTTSFDGSFRVWNTATGKQTRRVRGHSMNAKFLSDGKRFAAGDSVVRVIDANTGKTLRRFEGDTMAIYAMAVSPDDRYVVTGGQDNVIKVWDIETGSLAGTRPSRDGVTFTDLAFTPDGCHLVVTDGNDLTLLELSSLRVVRVFESHAATAISVAPDGKTFVAAGNGAVRVWSIDIGGDEPSGRALAVVHEVQEHQPENSSATTESSESPSATPKAAGGEGDYRGRKHALVFGLAKYQEDALDNPENDARDMAESLQRIGFRVQLHLNPDLAQMRLALAEFESSLPPDAAALVYFAGHGVQYAGNSYLLPIGSIAKIETSRDLLKHSVSLSDMLSPLASRKDAVSILILDACRNSPFGDIPEIEAGLSRGTPVRAMTDITLPDSGGIKEGGSVSGSLIAYSTAPDTVAEDGQGRNSPYTKHLKEELAKPNTSFEDVLKATRLAVTKETNGRQTPWYESSIGGDFYPAGRGRIEFADLIRLFVPVEDGLNRREEHSNSYDWGMGAGVNSPIQWHHGGYADADRKHLFYPTGSGSWDLHYQRTGEVVITVNGKPTHDVLGTSVEEGKWNLVLLGLRGGVSIVKIETDIFTDRIPLPDFVHEMKACTQTFGSMDGHFVYRIKLPGHVPAFLGESFTCGASNCSAWYTIVYSREDTKVMGCS